MIYIACHYKILQQAIGLPKWWIWNRHFFFLSFFFFFFSSEMHCFTTARTHFYHFRTHGKVGGYCGIRLTNSFVVNNASSVGRGQNQSKVHLGSCICGPLLHYIGLLKTWQHYWKCHILLCWGFLWWFSNEVAGQLFCSCWRQYPHSHIL